MKTVLVLGLVFAAGCGKDDDNGKDGGGNSGNNTEKTVPDPEGTITVSMANNGVYDQGRRQYRGTGVCMDNNDCSAWIAMNYDNNFIAQACEIANVGKVNGLGSIKAIPNGGYTGYTSVESKNGYVIKSSSGIYTRLYVVDWILSTGGGIIGAKVKYQYSWNP